MDRHPSTIKQIKKSTGLRKEYRLLNKSFHLTPKAGNSPLFFALAAEDNSPAIFNLCPAVKKVLGVIIFL
jgi:hypothetical protein